ncbi:MAG: DUF2147 domain-containing protein [Paludibacter sp.]|nr:DUF2147 domain-containing protein [Bacteroidales bacterium]MCM1068465.1 DUF2147 domain-containing protein [Prevotella sp.]MCM1353419.1 DUF2147 domain-containing protein [Bacteroides sp.]MCM1442580.1 DUF2147 domain-containing protein [Muribaculum sp.]MCM1481425.1 DUF2147 domain-containing protein [Paludibacter sp.]
MKKTILALVALIVGSIAGSAQINEIVGEWYTVDDKTGESYSVVSIYKGSNGKYYGKITEMLLPGTEDEICTACKDEDKNKRILGMVIIRDMVEKDGVLSGGKVLDPDNGKFYYGKIYIENGKLALRGSLDKWGALGRTQFWKKKK